MLKFKKYQKFKFISAFLFEKKTMLHIYLLTPAIFWIQDIRSGENKNDDWIDLFNGWSHKKWKPVHI